MGVTWALFPDCLSEAIELKGEKADQASGAEIRCRSSSAAFTRSHSRENVCGAIARANTNRRVQLCVYTRKCSRSMPRMIR
jgi:hypothetical protein